MHLYSLCQTWLNLTTHTASETENRTSCLTTVSVCGGGLTMDRTFSQATPSPRSGAKSQTRPAPAHGLPARRGQGCEQPHRSRGREGGRGWPPEAPDSPAFSSSRGDVAVYNGRGARPWRSPWAARARTRIATAVACVSSPLPRPRHQSFPQRLDPCEAGGATETAGHAAVPREMWSQRGAPARRAREGHDESPLRTAGPKPGH